MGKRGKGMSRITANLDCTTNQDFMVMLFITQMDNMMGTPGRHDFCEMTHEEREAWRAFQKNFKWPDEDPGWME